MFCPKNETLSTETRIILERYETIDYFPGNCWSKIFFFLTATIFSTPNTEWVPKDYRYGKEFLSIGTTVFKCSTKELFLTFFSNSQKKRPLLGQKKYSCFWKSAERKLFYLLPTRITRRCIIIIIVVIVIIFIIIIIINSLWKYE